RVVRNDEKLEFLDSVFRTPMFDGRSSALDHGRSNDGPCGAAIQPGIAGRTAFTIRAQTGCEEACAYCIIPSTRGASRSLSVDAIVAEVRRVAGAGFKEVTLT